MTDYYNSRLYHSNGQRVTQFDHAQQMALKAARAIDPGWTHPTQTPTVLFGSSYRPSGFDT
jgi:hypothetical protein